MLSTYFDLTYLDNIVYYHVDNKIVGELCITHYPENNTIYIDSVNIFENCRGKGYGYSFLTELIETLKVQIPIYETHYELKYINLEVFDNNIPAINLYRKIGFEEYDRKNYIVFMQYVI